MLTIEHATIDTSKIIEEDNILTISIILTVNRPVPKDKEVRAIVLQNLKHHISNLEGHLI